MMAAPPAALPAAAAAAAELEERRAAGGSAGTPARDAFVHTPCYCEENALLLSRRLVSSGAVPSAGALSVVFVTNPRRQLPLWRQRAGRADMDGLVVWDYHVFVVEVAHAGLAEPRVWDLDTTLPFPCPLSEYAAAALPPVRRRYARRFRVVPAAQLWRHFASDRSHMRSADGSWAMPPPAYPPFVAQSDGCANRLQAYLDVGLTGGGRGSGSGSGSGSGGSSGGSSDEDGGRGRRGGSGGAAPPLRRPPAAGLPQGEMGAVCSEGAFLLSFLRPAERL